LDKSPNFSIYGNLVRANIAKLVYIKNGLKYKKQHLVAGLCPNPLDFKERDKVEQREDSGRGSKGQRLWDGMGKMTW